jgi:hypothetical protein
MTCKTVQQAQGLTNHDYLTVRASQASEAIKPTNVASVGR